MRKRNLFLLIIFTIIYFSFADVRAKKLPVIYGRDDRVAIGASPHRDFQKLGRSTLAMISRQSIHYEYSGLLFSLQGPTLQDNMGVCQGEKFATYPTYSLCSGFLISSKHMLTAGHCIKGAADCALNKWMFDYRQELTSSAEKTYYDTNNLFSCEKVIRRAYDVHTKLDFALIELDREVEGRAPLQYRKTGKVADGRGVFVIGHPSGLPSVVADNAHVRDNSHEIFFSTNLDTFSGNSGSAVFNADSGLVEGILVRGENDYKFDTERDCFVPFTCQNESCRGEEATRIVGIFDLSDL